MCGHGSYAVSGGGCGYGSYRDAVTGGIGRVDTRLHSGSLY